MVCRVALLPECLYKVENDQSESVINTCGRCHVPKCTRMSSELSVIFGIDIIECDHVACDGASDCDTLRIS